jgi:hypothetical protein
MINGSAGNGITGIWTLTTDGGGFQQLQSGTGEATLSADGSRIVFEKDQQLWQMEPNGENLVRLIQLPHDPQFAGHAGLFELVESGLVTRRSVANLHSQRRRKRSASSRRSPSGGRAHSYDSNGSRPAWLLLAIRQENDLESVGGSRQTVLESVAG